MTTQSDEGQFRDDPSRPRPVRIATAGAALIAGGIGVLPLFGLPISAEQQGGLTLVLALALGLVGILLERSVTPMSDPRAHDGAPLVRFDTLRGPENGPSTEHLLRKLRADDAASDPPYQGFGDER